MSSDNKGLLVEITKTKKTFKPESHNFLDPGLIKKTLFLVKPMF